MDEEHPPTAFQPTSADEIRVAGRGGTGEGGKMAKKNITNDASTGTKATEWAGASVPPQSRSGSKYKHMLI
jgi:hypothetical protein